MSLARGTGRALLPASILMPGRAIPKQKRIPESAVRLSQQAVYVRPSDGISSMAEGFAIARAIERKFGKIRDVLFTREPESPHFYQSYFWCIFEDAVSRERIPSDAVVIQARVPLINAQLEGGVGLSDLQGLLTPADYRPEELNDEALEDPEEEGQKQWGLVDVRIEKAQTMTQLPVAAKSEFLRHGPFFAETWSQWCGFSSALPEVTVPQPHLDSVNARWRQVYERWRKNNPEWAARREQAVDSVQVATAEGHATDQHAVREEPPIAWTPIKLGTLNKATPAQTAVEDTDTVVDKPDLTADAINETDPQAKLSKRERILQQARENARIQSLKKNMENEPGQQAEVGEVQQRADAGQLAQQAKEPVVQQAGTESRRKSIFDRLKRFIGPSL
ncbi:hypothetical protein EW146_g7908 [Bondarzewia mesenterica]|uniref:Uncharacterized protein n=1 Tax=Bondarzewia mesenterica TaxID=1095465 RepID=A0A4S4LJ45_9AGAM|nr:hypothetical protein EW146_g7908 [Bondarzewia mesenterica]